MHAAEHKPWHLCLAAQTGLAVPETLITNDPEAAAGFADEAAPVLYKAFRSRPAQVAGTTKLVYATPVSAEQCRTDSVRQAPVLLQRHIDKRHDVRVTTVDSQMYAITPTAPGDVPPVDWRVDHGANRWQPIDVPDRVADSLRVMLGRLGLRFAACDFTVDRDGTWWFLEVNAAGQWAWDHPERDRTAAALAGALSEVAA